MATDFAYLGGDSVQWYSRCCCSWPGTTAAQFWSIGPARWQIAFACASIYRDAAARHRADDVLHGTGDPAMLENVESNDLLSGLPITRFELGVAGVGAMF